MLLKDWTWLWKNIFIYFMIFYVLHCKSVGFGVISILCNTVNIKVRMIQLLKLVIFILLRLYWKLLLLVVKYSFLLSTILINKPFNTLLFLERFNFFFYQIITINPKGLHYTPLAMCFDVLPSSCRKHGTGHHYKHILWSLKQV